VRYLAQRGPNIDWCVPHRSRRIMNEMDGDEFSLSPNMDGIAIRTLVLESIHQASQISSGQPLHHIDGGTARADDVTGICGIVCRAYPVSDATQPPLQGPSACMALRCSKEEPDVGFHGGRKVVKDLGGKRACHQREQRLVQRTRIVPPNPDRKH
jgi:hypothetical protein